MPILSNFMFFVFQLQNVAGQKLCFGFQLQKMPEVFLPTTCCNRSEICGSAFNVASEQGVVVVFNWFVWLYETTDQLGNPNCESRWKTEIFNRKSGHESVD